MHHKKSFKSYSIIKYVSIKQRHLSKISNHQKAGGSITTKACELYKTLWSVGAYTASNNSLRGRGYGQVRLGYSSP